MHPEQYLGTSFEDYHLQVNYRSPKNIVEHSQRLISNNKNRVSKRVKAAEGADTAKIEIKTTSSISERLALVTNLVRNTPGKIAVISRTRGQLIPYQIYFASGGAPFETELDLDVFISDGLERLIMLLEVWERSQADRRLDQVVSDVNLICDTINRYHFSYKNKNDLSRHLHSSNPESTTVAVAALKDYDGPKLSGKNDHQQLYEIASDFLQVKKVADVLRIISRKFEGLQFDRERSKDDIFFTAPPLGQLADICENEGFDVNELIKRIDAAKRQIQKYRDFDADDNENDENNLEKPLHLMTATRAKGKEFDTIVLLDTVDGIWPHRKINNQRDREAERRLFYVAFTRARRRVVMLMSEDGRISPFVEELELKGIS